MPVHEAVSRPPCWVRSLVQGGRNITGGIRSGVTGIFTAPVSGAKKEGMGGFFKGVGKGLVGAVVKPVVGVTDAAVSVVQVRDGSFRAQADEV